MTEKEENSCVTHDTGAFAYLACLALIHHHVKKTLCALLLFNAVVTLNTCHLAMRSQKDMSQNTHTYAHHMYALPEENAAHTRVAHEDDEKENEKVEKIAGGFLDGACDETHALLRVCSIVCVCVFAHSHDRGKAG